MYILTTIKALVLATVLAGTAVADVITAYGPGPAGGGGPLALDGVSHTAGDSGGLTTYPLNALTTTQSNDVIVISGFISGASVSSISSANTSGWARRIAANAMEIWEGKASSPLSAEVITLTLSASSGATGFDAFGISGADTTAIHDPNGALPASAASSTVAITTTNANTLIFACYGFNSTASPTQGAGWTLLSGANFLLTEYKIVSAPQSGLVATIGTGNTDEAAGVADAITQ